MPHRVSISAATLPTPPTPTTATCAPAARHKPSADQPASAASRLLASSTPRCLLLRAHATHGTAPDMVPCWDPPPHHHYCTDKLQLYTHAASRWPPQ